MDTSQCTRIVVQHSRSNIIQCKWWSGWGTLSQSSMEMDEFPFELMMCLLKLDIHRWRTHDWRVWAYGHVQRHCKAKQHKITRAASDGSSKLLVFPTKNHTLLNYDQGIQWHERVSTRRYDEHFSTRMDMVLFENGARTYPRSHQSSYNHDVHVPHERCVPVFPMFAHKPVTYGW